jgi:hypothetical protein
LLEEPLPWLIWALLLSFVSISSGLRVLSVPFVPCILDVMMLICLDSFGLGPPADPVLNLLIFCDAQQIFSFYSSQKVKRPYNNARRLHPHTRQFKVQISLVTEKNE